MTAVAPKSSAAPLSKTIGQRLRVARSCAGMQAKIAAERLGYSNATQISLAENGERIPPLHTLIEYAKLYVVPLDLLCGLIDDPIADATETNQGVIANAVADAIKEQFGALVRSVSEQASITIAGYNQDRRDLQATCTIAQQAWSALERVRELNPEFDDDWRGTARLVMHLDGLAQIGEQAAQRLKHEKRRRELTAGSLSTDELAKSARRALVRYTVEPATQNG
ncbi:helix-turn-helix transcriptional regulator [Pseudomonas aeruginosa]|uniref:helix-turn-helix domain-containing protein n=1 Tax=Pseudomonas aeruginosa TaxID=287 RepID=UPI00106886AE|nr:helix-turn-helix transcriptional regulator [Pseudomonas aeruginosa]TER18038.1 XRE family transcriptional regulator [Pseudomonas aeruginosa]